MRSGLLGFGLATLVVGCQGSQARPVDREGTAATVFTVVDTVRQGEVFELGFPDDEAVRACIKIPADAVPAGTEVSISLITNRSWPDSLPAPFRRAREGGRIVFPPVFEFKAQPGFEIGDASARAAIGICVDYTLVNTVFFEKTRLARPAVAGDSLEYADLANPCTLSCAPSPRHYRTAALKRLFAGSPLSATTLHANTISAGVGGWMSAPGAYAAVER